METIEEDEFDLEAQLYHVIIKNDHWSLRRLIREGVDVNTRYIDVGGVNETPLHICCKKGLNRCAEILIDGRADINSKDGWLMTPLMYAVMCQFDDTVELLLIKGAEVNSIDRHGKTAMHFAVESNNIQCVEILIAGGAWINEADRQGRTPVYMAAAGRSSMEMLELLLDNPDCNIHLKDHQFGRTPLQGACLNSEVAKVEMLLERGADPSELDGSGNSPLMNVIWSCPERAVVSDTTMRKFELLINAGADINVRSANGTALAVSAFKGIQEFVDILLSLGADPNIEGTRHLVALHHAALKNHLEIAKSLIRANAKLDPIGYKDFNDYQEPFTPLRMAAHEGHFDIVRLLVDSGYDLHQESYLWEELDLPRKLKNNAPLMSFMHFHLHMPPSLARRCIQTIRRVCSEDIFSKVMSMEYPSSLKNSILLTDVLNDC